MHSRKSSAVSAASVKHRKFSTTRLQRQAELSLLNEETHPRGSEGADSFEYFSFKARSSLTRSDTGGLSPFEFHPGQRVRGFSRTSFSWTPESVRGSFVKPFDEPDFSEAQNPGRRFPVVKRTQTGPLDVENAQAKIERPALDAKAHNVFPRRVYNRAHGRRAVKPGAFRGLEYISSFATAHANAILLQQPSTIHERQALYVFDFESSVAGLVLCGSPQAFQTAAGLKRYLDESGRQSLMRIIYVCNQYEAINYLDSTFGIDDSTGTDPDRGLRAWMQKDRMSRGASNKAIRWRPTYDSARGLICSAFGLDFGSIILTEKDPQKNVNLNASQAKKPTKTLNHLYRQRLSVYMQKHSRNFRQPANMTEFNTASKHLPKHTYSNTIIISEYSSGEVGEIVSTPSLMTLDTGTMVIPGNPSDQAEISATQSCIVHILSRIWQIWHHQISLIHDEHANLEDHVYEAPADGSRVANVWAMSQHLHDMLKLMNRHAKVIEAIQEDFQLFAESTDEQRWLDQTIDEFTQLSNDLSTDYLEPLEHMIDLMYKSVSIRDSEQSLELAISLWRLSWITFIFLPLTFLVGFFGMNVASFQPQYPSIRWYFIAAVPLMVLVFASWFGLRRFLPSTRASRPIGYSDFELLSLRKVADHGAV